MNKNDLVPENWLWLWKDEKGPMTIDQYVTIRNDRSYRHGKSAGIKKAAEFIREAAAKAFLMKDDKAVFLRNLADTLEKLDE